MNMMRRDRCYLVGKRAGKLAPAEAAAAWQLLAGFIEDMGERDIPKFNDLLTAVRKANIEAKSVALVATQWAEYLHVLDYDT